MLGSETTIYITTAQQLKRLADEVNAGDSKSDKTYLLANDIDLSGYPNWTPIGTFNPNSPQADLSVFWRIRRTGILDYRPENVRE